MTHKYPLIAAGVAAALAAGAQVQAVAPTIAQAAANTTNTLVIAGSSAAKNAIIGGVEADVCGDAGGTTTNNTLLVSSSNGSKNFFALACNIPVAIGTIPATTLVTIYYRTEGGSVVGALPIAASHTIQRLNLSGSCSGTGITATCNITGTTAANGPNDSWATSTTPATVQLGVVDVEPGLLTGNDYPTQYATSAFGSATTAQMKALNTAKKPLFSQVFGLVVNNKGGSLPATINLTKQSAANILQGLYSDWHKVPDALTGAPIASAASAITVVHREAGSGTRTSANTYFLGYQCSSSLSIPGTTTGNFSTTDLMTQVNTTVGSVGYASIDNVQDPHTGTSFTNVVLATINGVAPSNLGAATGEYDYWFEAGLIPSSTLAGSALALSNFLVGDLPKLATAPAEPDVNVIPGVAGNVAAVPLTSNGKTGTSQIYINPYTRSGNSCAVPGEQN